MLMLAALLGGVVVASKGFNGKELASEIAGKLKETIESVGKR
jgi:hypothetical protein